jgi:hypothetical protein
MGGMTTMALTAASLIKDDPGWMMLDFASNSRASLYHFPTNEMHDRRARNV